MNRYNPKSKIFKCDRYCGECCKRLIINLTKDDVKRIRNLGYDDEDFLTKELIGPDRNKPILRYNKNGCVFLEKEKSGKYSCIINRVKPEICSKYPFIGPKPNDCRPSKWPDNKALKTRIKI